MKTLTIKDLCVTTELDNAAMSSVRGGTYKGGSSWLVPGYGGSSKHDFSFDAQQLTSQHQENMNVTGNNAAFVSGIQSTFKPVQSSSNSISF